MSTPTAPTGISRVVRDPSIQGGEPTVRGFRTTVRSVVLAEREWGGVDGVQYAYPHLRTEDVADGLAYYLEHREEIEGYITRNGDGG